MFSKAPTAMTVDTAWELAQGYYPILIHERIYPMVTPFGPCEKVGFNSYRMQITLLIRT